MKRIVYFEDDYPTGARLDFDDIGSLLSWVNTFLPRNALDNLVVSRDGSARADFDIEHSYFKSVTILDDSHNDALCVVYHTLPVDAVER